MPDVIQEFLGATFERRLTLVHAPAHEAALRGYLGAAAFDEYRNLARTLDGHHLSGRPPENLVFVPGVMGSLLYSHGLCGVWWLDLRSLKHIKDLRLASDGQTDADPRARLEPFGLDSTYEAFFAATYQTDDFRHVAFAYDWRKPLAFSAARLRDTIVTAAQANGGRPVHLVAHSMGGLMVRLALARHPDLWDRIGRVVFLGTPHYGAPAIAGYLKNHLWGFELLALLGRYLDRATFRTLWGVLSLLPAPSGTYPDTRQGESHPCVNFDPYDARAWRLDMDEDERRRLQTVLDAAAAQHRELRSWHVGLDQDQRDRMAAIVGVGYRTLFRLAYHEGFGFHWRHMDRVVSRKPGDPHRDGDGRVPIASAALEWLGENRYVRAEHGQKPGVPAVSADVFRFLSSKRMQLPESPEAALDEHLAATPETSATPTLSATNDDPNGEDPGYLEVEPYTADRLDNLDVALANGRLPDFARVRLL
jgi:pimeloyl-ACP methyl ester carboxylesterase